MNPVIEGLLTFKIPFLIYRAAAIDWMMKNGLIKLSKLIETQCQVMTFSEFAI